MKKVIFVCHGNICRSPAAEFIFLKVARELGRGNEFEVSSKATSYEEIGNDIYPPMKRALISHQIPFKTHRASRFTLNDYLSSDYIFYMDENNIRNLYRICDDPDNKYYPVFKWTQGIYHIEDPWYTDNYDKVIKELTECIIDILKHI